MNKKLPIDCDYAKQEVFITAEFIESGELDNNNYILKKVISCSNSNCNKASNFPTIQKFYKEYSEYPNT